MRRLTFISALVAAAAAMSLAGEAAGWGSTGHRVIGRLALQALPPELPDFLRGLDAVEAVGEYAREPDRWKGSGRAHDADQDPAHFLDLGDDGRIFGGPALQDLPDTRAAYDASLRAVSSDSWKAGYLPYAIIETWQQLANDLTFWRVENAAIARVKDPAHLAWFRMDMAARQALVLRDVGVLAHYAGDGSQPLHVTVHFNGWGPYPNPERYATEHIHGPFEGPYVHDMVDPAAVARRIGPYRPCSCRIEAWTRDYLQADNRQVVPFYRLWKAGGFAGGDPRGKAFGEERLAAGATAVRDLIAQAWDASAASKVGWPGPITVAQVEAGLDPYDALYGVD